MLKALVAIGVLQVLTMLFQLVRTKALAVMLGPEAIGVMAVIDKLLAVLAQTASLSFPFAAVRFLPQLWHDDPRRFDGVYRAMRRVLAATVGAATLIALGVTIFAPKLWGATLLPYRHVILLAVMTIPALAAIPFLQNVVAAQMRQNRAMLIAVANAGVLCVASIVGVWAGGLAGNYLAYALLGLAFMVVVGAIARAPRSVPTATQPNRELPPLLWRFSAAMLTLTFVTPYAALFVHYRVLSMLGAQAAGWMQAAIGVSIAVRAVLGSSHAVFLTPGVNRGGTPAERMMWASQFQSTLCLLAGATVPLLLLFPQIAVGVLYSRQFAPGAQFVAIFVLAELLGLVAATYQALVVAFDHLAFHVVQNLAAQLVLVGIAAVTIERYGIAGAGAAGLAAQLVLYSATTAFLRARQGVRIPGRVAMLTGFVLLASAAAGAAGVVWQTMSWTPVLLKLAAYLAILFVLSMFLTRADRDRLAEMVGRLRGRLQPVRP